MASGSPFNKKCHQCINVAFRGDLGQYILEPLQGPDVIEMSSSAMSPW